MSPALAGGFFTTTAPWEAPGHADAAAKSAWPGQQALPSTRRSLADALMGGGGWRMHDLFPLVPCLRDRDAQGPGGSAPS